MLTYGLLADVCNEYYRLDESTASECIKRFVITIRACFESNYLKPTHDDFKH